MSTGTGDFKQLLYAARDGDLQAVQYWIKRGSDPNFLHAEFMMSPFHYSLRNRHHDVAKFLLENGADPHKPEGYSNASPIQIARENNDANAVALLQSFGVTDSVWSRLRTSAKKRFGTWLLSG